MVGGDVGATLIKWLIQNHRDDIELVVCSEVELELIGLFEDHKVPYIVWDANDCTEGEVAYQIRFASIEIGFLLWWPKIIGTELLFAPKHGFINLHPSLLPFGRGKNPNFWAIKDGEPFGVSIHLVDIMIDHGPVLVQKQIEVSWLDNGKSTYDKSITEIVSLFKANYVNLGEMVRSQSFKAQDFERGSYHNSKQLDDASDIGLDRHFVARDLLNLIRARTFQGRPSCFFTEGGKQYSVTIKIEDLE